MAVKSINLQGTSGQTYDMDKLVSSNTRTSSDESLVVQIWMWNPNLTNSHKNPNPPAPSIGQIWLSKLVTTDSDDYKALEKLTDNTGD